MENIDILILCISIVIGFQVTREIFDIRYKNEKEADNFFNNMSSKENNDLTGYVCTNGLTLFKSSEEKKYNLIPQNKLVDICLS